MQSTATHPPKNVGKPKKNFRDSAQRLKALMALKTRTEDEQLEHKHLEAQLRTSFMKAFGLEPDRLRVASNFFHRFCNSPLAPKHKLLDHQDFFRRGENIVLVSQLYGQQSVENEIQQWALDSGATCTIASEWGYYYPERAGLFFIEFSPEAKAQFDARLRRL